MNLHIPFFTRPEPAPLSDLPMRSHGRFTTSPKEKQRMSRKASIVAQLAVYAAVTTPSQRKAEADAWFAAQLTYAAETRRGR